MILKPIPKPNASPPDVRASGGGQDALGRQHLRSVYQNSNLISTGIFPEITYEPIPPSLVDSLTTLQATNERELTSCLCQNPYTVLKLAGGFLPEIASRERSFWMLVKKTLPYNLTYEDVTQFLLDLIKKNGYQNDYNQWERLYFEHFITALCNSEERAKELLIEITACHNARSSLEIVYHSQRFQELEGYYD